MEQPKQPMTIEKKCDSCDKLLQRYSEDGSQIESYVYYWYVVDGKNLCLECKDIGEQKNG